MNAFDEVLKYLPADIQAVIRHPPTLSDPSSFIPAFRLIAPYFKWIIVLMAFYIVWSAIAGVMGYFYRFMKFWAKLTPILGVIAWVMASSGQGSLPEVFELVKQWVGISDGAAGGQQAPGIAQLAGMFGLGGNNAGTGRTANKPRTRSSTRRTKGAAAAGSGAGADADAGFADILRSATGIQSDDDWQDTVQGYVKQALAKASGLEWLFGQAEPPKTRAKRTR